METKIMKGRNFGREMVDNLREAGRDDEEILGRLRRDVLMRAANLNLTGGSFTGVIEDAAFVQGLADFTVDFGYEAEVRS